MHVQRILEDETPSPSLKKQLTILLLCGNPQSYPHHQQASVSINKEKAVLFTRYGFNYELLDARLPSLGDS